MFIHIMPIKSHASYVEYCGIKQRGKEEIPTSMIQGKDMPM